ncbi:MAG: alkaline phosphatase family protein [Acidimicrobiales bacterium]
MTGSRISRRRLLGAAAAGALGVGVGAAGGGLGSRGSWAGAASPLGLAGRDPSGRGVLPAGTRPDPRQAAGTDLVRAIERFVVVMMENHSFDNLLGMMGRGDCLAKGPDGRPTITLPDGHGDLVHAFHMPSECQTNGVGNNWNLAHHSYAAGANTGFVEASTGESLGYFLRSDLPFTWSLAGTYPIADRWFSSVLGQTDPNRRYLLAGTSLGQIADNFPDDLPPNGTVFDLFNRFGLTWKDYFSNLPSAGVWLPLLAQPAITEHLVPIDSFFADAAAGRLPQFSLVEPDYTKSSEENPQDIQFGDQFLADVVNAVTLGPQWSNTMLIWTYDEWGGWYDHVPPPMAVTPDNVAPDLSPNSARGRFDRYGFRVPAGVVSPLARADFVSHRVYDHTSVLKTLERKWNLPALTRRDANAHDLFDMVDLDSPPAFGSPRALAIPANPALSASCLVTGPGRIPPKSAVDKGAVHDTPTIRPQQLPAGIVGVPYRATLKASPTGGRPRWSVLSDDLPAGLLLDPHTGAITGTPTAAGTSGVTVGVQRRGGPVGARSYRVTVAT